MPQEVTINKDLMIPSELARRTIELRDYVDNVPIGLHSVDENGLIKWANKAELNLLGYTAEEYIGHHISEFHEDQAKINDILSRLSSNETLKGFESDLRCKDGSTKSVLISSNVFWEDGKFVHTRCFTVDVTAQKKLVRTLYESESRYMVKLRQLTASLEKKVEERTLDLNIKNADLKKSEERYHKMIEEVEDYAIVLLDENGIIQNWNKGAEKIKGYLEGEIVGKSFRVFYLEEDRQTGLPEKLLAEAKINGKAIHEGWRVRKDGSSFWGSIVITALHDIKKNIVGFSKVTRDLTERKLAEIQLIEYSNKLEFQNKELEQFAYASSHDMKEPLRKISFYNNYILENPYIQLDEKSKEYLSRSISAVNRMSELIDALLAYSKTNSPTESFVETDLNEIMEDIALSNKDIIEEKRAQIEIGQLPTFNAIPFQWKQLMENLINNAVKYKHPDRISVIKISSDLVKGADIKNKEADPRIQYFKISVADNGIGFEPQFADKIFEIFQRLSNQPQSHGLGIGLAICKKIAQNHHGFIIATGKENEGARFDIYIPEK